MNPFHVIVLGGGAAGFFGALAAKAAHPEAKVLLLEKSAALLTKVRVSGGGRCNVTHACFDPKQLVLNYPRGSKELIGPFTRFQPKDTIEWFASRNVALKVESDGRMFPVTDSSETIIECFLKEARRLNVEIRTKQRVKEIQNNQDKFQLFLNTDEILECQSLLLATGSYPDGYAFAKNFGHAVVDPIPSLFTFNIPDSPLKDLAGISVTEATLKIAETPYDQTGPLLLTHWGFSGPAALKLSAWAAPILHQNQYKLPLWIDWIPGKKGEQIAQSLQKMRRELPGHTVSAQSIFSLPKNLWKRLVTLAGIEETKKFSETSNEALNKLSHRLKKDIYQVNGKTTYKEEFVTCGGIDLQEINFKTMESRFCKGLFFAGEILNIDAVTGGFNFQNAWTTGWLAGQNINRWRSL